MSEQQIEIVEVEAFDVDVKEAARLVSLSPGTLNDMRNKGDGPPFFYLRGAVRYGVADLKAWVSGRPRFRSTTEAALFEQVNGGKA